MWDFGPWSHREGLGTLAPAMATRPTSARKDWIFFGVFWVLLTIIGIALPMWANLLPSDSYAREAEIGDHAYKLLLLLAAPVFAGVAAMLLTIFLRQVDHRTSEEVPVEDGPPTQPKKGFVPVWLVVTGALALLLAINPGFVGLKEIRGESSADVVIKVKAMRWSWAFTYEDGQLSTEELVLPVDQRVRFEIESADIVHSFWVPAFRTKLDAVPNRTTILYITPEKVGDGANDSTLRVQCAELCGIDHTAMVVPVRIVEEDEYNAWLDSLAGGN